MRRFWTKAELRELRRLYPHYRTEEVARRLNRTVSAVYGQADICGIHKSANFLASEASGRINKQTPAQKLHRFPKGHTPWNAGLKGWTAGGRSSETRFRKGNKPQTWVPVGSERVTKDGIRQRKVTDTGYPPRDWKALHTILWTERNGPIPAGHIVIFKDKNRENVALENLECISRAENMRRNSYHQYPQPIPQLIQLRGAIQRQINMRKS